MSERNETDMNNEIIKEAASVDEAKALIAAEFGVAQDRIVFEVLQEAGKKVFGLFGSADAKVKGVLKASAADAAKAYLEDVLTAMGATDFTCEVKEDEKGCTLTLDGENLGFIIGRRGDTLDALQYLTGLVANRVDNAYYRVTLDIGNYREKREASLVSLAKRLGAQTARTGRRHSLEPMNPYERRIIHTAVQDMEGVISWSVGSDANRHVIIGPSDDNPNKDRAEESRGRRSRGGRGGRGGDRRDRAPRREHEIVAPERPVRQFISRSNPLPTADDITPPSRTESEKELNATLYGRIDI